MPIHIIDDQRLICELLCEALEEQSDQTRCFCSAEAYLDYWQSPHFMAPRLIISDVRMERIDGYTLIERLQQRNLHSKVIMMSGDRVGNLDAGCNICSFVPKPFDFRSMLLLASRVLDCADTPLACGSSLPECRRCPKLAGIEFG